MLVTDLLGPTEELPVICGLCGSPYDGDECPTSSADLEYAKRAVEERLPRNREKKDRIIRDLEKWLEAVGGE